MPVILHQARRHAGDRLRKRVTLIMSDLWARSLTGDDVDELTDVAELVITKTIGSGGPDDTETRNRSLAAMRRVLIDAQNVMVAVGGKMHAHDGVTPGVAEEMALAQEKGVPRFLVAGLGGFARKLASELAPESLMNSLSRDQNVELFGSDDVAATVNIVFEQLANSEALLRSAQQPIKWNPGLQGIVDHRDGTVDRRATDCILRAVAV